MTNQDQRIFLIGLPGSGKSTLGRALAAALVWPFVDLDEAIVAEMGRPIADIFQHAGEGAFRRLEAITLQRVGLCAPLVLATGGGTPCFHDSMMWLLDHGRVVWLDVPPTVIARRLLADPALAARPLLTVAQATPERAYDSLVAQLTQTFENRRAFYARAPHRVTTGTLVELRAVLGC